MVIYGGAIRNISFALYITLIIVAGHMNLNKHLDIQMFW
jgi:hypothetical protein